MKAANAERHDHQHSRQFTAQTPALPSLALFRSFQIIVVFPLGQMASAWGKPCLRM